LARGAVLDCSELEQFAAAKKFRRTYAAPQYVSQVFANDVDEYVSPSLFGGHRARACVV
jgi:hypothetical protein